MKFHLLLVVTIFIGYSRDMPDYKLYMSNRLDSFVKDFSHILQPGPLFRDKVCIVVQNKSIGDWLKLEIARHCGISANLNIVLPENAVRSFIHSFQVGRNLLLSPTGDGEKAVLFMDNLKIIIYKKLEHLLHTGNKNIEFSNSLYNSLEKYVKGLSSEESDYEAINSLRLYQLSDSIAGLFYYYGMNCQKLTASWEKNIPFFPAKADESLKNHEKWQMALWNELFTESSVYVHLSSILASIVEKKDIYDGDPCRIVLFGSAFLGDSSLQFFDHLSNYIPVDHFILSPGNSDDPFKMDLLKNWGSLFEGFKKLVKGETFANFTLNKDKTVLAHIQNSFIHNENPDVPFVVSEKDDSLKVISTTGKWREVEALKNRILKLLDSDDTLQLTDIGVLAPDINEYSHYIDAVFSSKGNTNLPYNIIDLRGDEDSPFISAFVCLLSLAGARFTRKELFSLFSNRCFAEKNGISSGEYNTWLEMCANVNIKWSVDENQKKELNVKGSRYNSWERGFDRILEGIALSEEEDPLAAPYELFNESSNVSAGKMMHIVRSLNLDINSLTGVKLQLEEWILLWESIMDTYLKPSESHPIDTKDRLRLKGCFRDILNMMNDLNNLEELENRQFDFFMFKSLIMEFINKSGGSKGRYLTQGISCSSLKPLRAVPFKILLVLGLNEEVFPAIEDPLSFDLKDSSYVKEIISIDLSRRSSDKYTFLEIFLSAREKVFLFYRGRNNVDNEKLQPSPLLTEMSEYFDKHFQCEDGSGYYKSIHEEEKLQPFDREYFSPGSPLFSYSTRDFNLARIYYNDKKVTERDRNFEEIPLKVEDSIIDITIKDLKKFLDNPVKYFFNRTIGVYMEDLEILEEDIFENIELDFFEKRSFLKDLVLSDVINDETIGNIDKIIKNYFQMQNRRGEIIDSELSIPDVEKISESVKQTVENLKNDNFLSSKPDPVVFTFGEKEDLEHNIIESPVIDLNRGIKVRLSGSLPPLYIYPDKTVTYIDIISGKKPSDHHWIQPFLINKLLPVKVKAQKGLKSFLVSPEEVFTTEFSQQDDLSLKQLVSSYIDNLENPIPLYPELAESLKDKKDPGKEISSSDLRILFLEKWIEEEGKMPFGYSEFKSCPYRFKAYSGLPEIDEGKLLNFYESSYRELFSVLHGNKD